MGQWHMTIETLYEELRRANTAAGVPYADTVVDAWLSDNLREELGRAAEAAGVPLGDFVVDALTRAAGGRAAPDA